MNQFELGILDFIWNNMHNAVCDFILPIITHLGDAGLFWIALAVIFLIFKKTRRLGISMAFALIIDLLCCNIVLKPLVQRIRPFDLNEQMKESIIALINSKLPADYSFPSGHTAASFASAFALVFKKSKFAIPALILAAIIAFSRLYLYIHYPTDVLVGIVVGLIAGYLGSLICTKLADYLKAKKGIEI